MNIGDIQQILDKHLEVEFSFYHTEQAAILIAKLVPHDIAFVLSWIERVSKTNIEIAHRFSLIAEYALNSIDKQLIENWLLHAIDVYDAQGLRAAIAVIENVDSYVKYGLERQYAVYFAEHEAVLALFIHGLSGRALKLKAIDSHLPYTDSETLYLPQMVATYKSKQDNFILLKSMLIHLWAQIRYGSFKVDLAQELAAYPDFERALAGFYLLETVRLDSCIKRELAGMYRSMQGLCREKSDIASEIVAQLTADESSVTTSLLYLSNIYDNHNVTRKTYQGILRPDLVNKIKTARVEREKALLKVALGEFAKKYAGLKLPKRDKAKFALQGDKLEDMTLTFNGEAVAPPEDISHLLSSIMLDFGEIPEDYLVAAGPGEYDVKQYCADKSSADAWTGTYHEEGAYLYHEWDYQRQHYKKNWTVIRELELADTDSSFYQETLDKHRGIILSLRKKFELLRGENKVMKAQNFGDEIDIDALVKARSDLLAGAEISERLFINQQKDERNIAVIFMVDMSGSTKGWINDAQRESLVLLAEALEALGDRYAIYGFSGWGRKRCEIYKIKQFVENYNEQVKGRICAITPKDYTRMGAPIRHLSQYLTKIAAKTKLLISISDGKPDDYGMDYRGQYGIEDTKMALQEAKREGIHSYCITIDKEGADYLPHMYGAASYTVLDRVDKLPLKIADIYRQVVG